LYTKRNAIYPAAKISIAGVSWAGGVHESTIIDCPIDTENPSGAFDAT